MSSFKYFTSTLDLAVAMQEAELNGYNRQIDKSFLDGMDPDTMFPVTFAMLHEHAAGVRVAPHVRVRFVYSSAGDVAYLDIPMHFWNSMPMWESSIDASPMYAV
jgi:hypothetical protein